MLSSQVPAACVGSAPRFYEMGKADKRTFWAYCLQALRPALNPNTSLRHTEPEGTIAMRSEGLCSLLTQTTGAMAAISIGEWIVY